MAGEQGRKKNTFATREYDISTGVLTFTYSDKSTALIKYGEYPENIKAELMGHGAKQKLGDEMAGCKTLPEAKQAVRDMDTLLRAGKFGVREGGSMQIGLLAEAMHAIAVEDKLVNPSTKSVWTRDETLALVASYSDEKRKERMDNTRVKKHIADITLRRAQEAQRAAAAAAKSTDVTGSALFG